MPVLLVKGQTMLTGELLASCMEFWVGCHLAKDPLTLASECFSRSLECRVHAIQCAISLPVQGIFAVYFLWNRMLQG